MPSKETNCLTVKFIITKVNFILETVNCSCRVGFYTFKLNLCLMVKEYLDQVKVKHFMNNIQAKGWTRSFTQRLYQNIKPSRAEIKKEIFNSNSKMLVTWRSEFLL